MKLGTRIAMLVVVGCVLAAATPLSWGLCGNGRVVNGCGGTCAYIVTPGLNTVGPTGSLRANFWGLGGGNPAIGVGDDNGSNLATGNADPGEDWLKSYAGQTYIGGAWSTNGVDGCIENATTPTPKRTVVAIMDSGAAGPTAKGYFAVLCKEITVATQNYDVYQLGAPNLIEVPYPRFQTSSRVSGTSVTATIKNAAANIAGGVLADPSCTPLIRGYKLYTQVRANSSGEPGSRAVSGWTQQGGELPLGQDAGPITVGCGPGTSVFFSTSLVLESGFETGYVSKHVRMPCDPTIADRPSNFKLVKVPRERAHTRD